MTDRKFGTSYFGVRDPNHATTDLNRFRESGLNAILHTFSERDLEYYRDTMADLVTASHDTGFTTYVNPWGVGGVFGGEAFSNVIDRHPETKQVLSSGETVPAACFNAPTFRKFMLEWTDAALNIGADVLFWDEPHWYIPGWSSEEIPEDVWSCRCEHCRERYREVYDESMPVGETDSVTRFREESLVDFLSELMAYTHERGGDNAVCLMPKETTEYGLRDWSRLAGEDHLDVLATDPYWNAFDETNDPAEFVGYFSNKVVDLAATNDLRSQIWVQGFGLDDEPSTADDVRTATRTALNADVDSIFMWGYDGCRTISEIACENPGAVWNAYLAELP